MAGVLLGSGVLPLETLSPEHCLVKGVQHWGSSGPHWKDHLGLHIKYIETRNHKTTHNVLSKFTILCWAACTAILGLGLDTPGAPLQLKSPRVAWASAGCTAPLPAQEKESPPPHPACGSGTGPPSP